jgi:hypothetical protein
MPLLRSISQGHQSLTDFYQEAVNSSEQVTMEIGQSMLRLIHRINKHFETNQIWGLTSHYHLKLLTGPEALSEAPISFISNNEVFKLATQFAPEINDYQKNQEFYSEDEFFEHLLSEMRKSKPWTNFKELW